MIKIDAKEVLYVEKVDALMAKINTQNKKILIDFEEYLKIAGLSPKTIKKHI